MSFLQITAQLLNGFVYTLAIFGITLVTAIPLGLVVAFGSMSKFHPLRALSRGLVWVIRGTPLMLQIIVFAYGPGLWLGIPIRTTQQQIMMVCIAFAINYACYFSEIFRGGIESISEGQYEAGYVLGMTKRQIFFRVVLLQVTKRIVAPMSNEIITLVKDTALASVVVHVDLFTVAKQIVNREVILWPLFYAGVFYLIFNGLLTVLLSKLEKKLDYFKV
jgi:polar amino acid transport system permease protein